MVQRLKFIGEILANALNRKRTQEALDERMRFEILLTTLMAELANIAPNEIDKVIEEGLRLLGEFFDADRVSISQPLGKDGRFWPSHLWLSESYDLAEHMESLSGPFSFPNITRHIAKEGFFVLSRREDLPGDWEQEGAFLDAIGCKAGAVVALRIRNELMGVVTVASLRREREWPEDLAQRLKFIGEILARALLCKRAEATLERALSEIGRLKARHAAKEELIEERIEACPGHDRIVGGSEAIRKVLEEAREVSATDSTVLLLGETGTGKELVAQDRKSVV